MKRGKEIKRWGKYLLIQCLNFQLMDLMRKVSFLQRIISMLKPTWRIKLNCCRITIISKLDWGPRKNRNKSNRAHKSEQVLSHHRKQALKSTSLVFKRMIFTQRAAQMPKSQRWMFGNHTFKTVTNFWILWIRNYPKSKLN